MNQPAREQWEAALARWLDGEPEPGDGELLAAAMRQDPAALREVSGLLAVDELLRQHAELSPEDFQEAFAERLAADADRAFVRRLQKSLPRSFACSTGHAAVAIRRGCRDRGWHRRCCMFLLRSAPQPEVATLLLADQCEWQQPGFVEEGQRLVAGTLRLRQGLAVLRCDGGAELDLARRYAGRASIRRPGASGSRRGDRSGAGRGGGIQAADARQRGD